MFPGFCLSRFQDRLQIPPVSLAPLTAVTHRLSCLPTLQKITPRLLLWIPYTPASQKKAISASTGLLTPRTTMPPQPRPPPFATMHPVRQSIWIPSEPQSSSPTPAWTVRTVSLQRLPLAISIRGNQAAMPAIVNRSHTGMCHGCVSLSCI